MPTLLGHVRPHGHRHSSTWVNGAEGAARAGRYYCNCSALSPGHRAGHQSYAPGPKSLSGGSLGHLAASVQAIFPRVFSHSLAILSSGIFSSTAHGLPGKYSPGELYDGEDIGKK